LRPLQVEDAARFVAAERGFRARLDSHPKPRPVEDPVARELTRLPSTVGADVPSRTLFTVEDPPTAAELAVLPPHMAAAVNDRLEWEHRFDAELARRAADKEAYLEQLRQRRY
jgi:hypothetical protein